jgi:hypothetical protein
MCVCKKIVWWWRLGTMIETFYMCICQKMGWRWWCFQKNPHLNVCLQKDSVVVASWDYD